MAVREAYLPALPHDPRFAERVRIREVSIGSTRQLIDFDGTKTSHAEVARRLRVKFAPTVLFLDASGQPRAEALLGGDSVGLYGGYLDKRVTQALAARRYQSRAAEYHRPEACCARRRAWCRWMSGTLGLVRN